MIPPEAPEAICPGCQGPAQDGYFIPRQPAILNYRFRSARAAAEVARVDITLALCARCGLVFNRTFAADRVPYDQNYDNSQIHSSAFQAYLESLATGWIEKWGIRRRQVLEVGCGKGAFLELFCRLGENQGTGYDTTYEESDAAASSPVRFFARYLNASEVDRSYQALLCRHVIEHVPQIGDFLRDLAQIARAAGDPIIFLETPSLEWILENGSFWDLFHEHCNYFSLPTLAYLCRQAGLEVLEQATVFQGQYQTLVARLSGADTSPTPPRLDFDLSQFGIDLDRSRRQLEQTLTEAGCARGWAIWGAGAKGVALVNRLEIAPPRFVIDLNPDKQGGVIPGSEVPIVSPDHPDIAGLAVILVANPNYREEIEDRLRSRRYAGQVVTA